MQQASLYLDRRTFIHRLDPRTKMVATAAIFAVAMAYNHPAQVAAVAALSLALAAWARCLGNVWRVKAILFLLVLFSMILWPVFLRGGTPLFSLGPLRIGEEPALYGLAMGIRLGAMLTAGMVLISTTMIEEFAAGLRRFGLPFSVAFAFSTAFRLVPTFLGSSGSVVQAQKARGLDLETGGIFSRLRKHIPLMVPIFINAVRTTDLLAMALESKGFGSSRRRTEYLDLHMRWADWLVTCICVLAACAAIYSRAALGFGALLPRL
jgi:energy-coupling factor transport system permease protein